MSGERQHNLEVGDRVIARSNHCGPRTAASNPPTEHVGVIVEITGNTAWVDCDGEELKRNLGQLEYYPPEDVYEQRKLDIRIEHFWMMRRRSRHEAG